MTDRDRIENENEKIRQKVKERVTAGLERCGVPSHMHEGYLAYILTGRPVGGFLQYVLENKLVDAFGRADATNTIHMRNHADFVYNFVPIDAWGSEEKVAKWIEKRGLSGQTE